MKKILLATSVLAGTAGFAAADITLSGDARMGVLNGFVLTPGAQDKTGFTSRFRVAFTATGASDNGLEFGAFVRLHQGAQAEQGTKGNVWVSGAFGKLTMGDIDSAAHKATGGHINGVGLTGLGDLNELTYLGHEAVVVDVDFHTGTTAANSAALYEYSANGFGFYLSASNPNHVYNGGAWEGKSYAVGASYAIDGYKFGVAYEKLDSKQIANPIHNVEASQWVIGADADFGQFLLQARYAQGDVSEDNGVNFTGDTKQYSVGATYKADALAVTAYVSRKEIKSTGVFAGWTEKTDAYGLGASYDLGGGASVVGGIANRKNSETGVATVKDTAFDLGLSFKF